jgi:uncharacterized DUF497 family protein
VEFEYDPAKSEANKRKHGIDFEQAKELWNDEYGIEIQSNYKGETRWVRIAKSGGTLWTGIFTYRETSIRIISVRRGRRNEKFAYEKSTENG